MKKGSSGPPVVHAREFTFHRSRGLVWVCDVAGSSKLLNDDASAAAVEDFLPRLHWTASLLVEAAGGKFIKWTGDGFLAWFETPLYRELGKQARVVFKAASHLTALVNVTQLGVKRKCKFRIRHGVAYEQDALLTTISQTGGFESLDVSGRGVVLAFRLSGVTAKYPCIATQRELVRAIAPIVGIHFRPWTPTVEDRLRFFKGERWGTSSLYVSSNSEPKARSGRSLVKLVKNAIHGAESENSADPDGEFSQHFITGMLSGPDWGVDVVGEFARFTREELLGNLKRLLPTLEELASKKTG